TLLRAPASFATKVCRCVHGPVRSGRVRVPGTGTKACRSVHSASTHRASVSTGEHGSKAHPGANGRCQAPERNRGASSTAVPKRRVSGFAEADLLRALPEHPPAELAKILAAFHDRREVVAGKRTRLAAERDIAVREE